MGEVNRAKCADRDARVSSWGDTEGLNGLFYGGAKFCSLRP